MKTLTKLGIFVQIILASTGWSQSPRVEHAKIIIQRLSARGPSPLAEVTLRVYPEEIIETGGSLVIRDFDTAFKEARLLKRKSYVGLDSDVLRIKIQKDKEEIVLESWHPLIESPEVEVDQHGAHKLDPKNEKRSYSEDYKHFRKVWNLFTMISEKHFGFGVMK